MKIILVSSAYHPYYRGGGEYSVKSLAQGLLKSGQQVSVITAHEQASVEEIDGVTVRRVKHPNLYWSFRSAGKSALQKLAWHVIESYNIRVASRVAGILEEQRPDVLHLRNVEDFSPYVAKVAYQRNIPVVVTLNSYTWLCPKATMYKNGHSCKRQCLDCKLLTYPKKYLSQYVDAVVGVSQFMINQHHQYHYFPKAHPLVIYTSADSQPLPLPAQQNGFLTFGYIGRIHPTKGVHQIIKAFHSIPPPHQLIIAGDGPEAYVQKCQTAAAGNPRIVFLGKYPAAAFYQQVDVLLINALWNEPFPRVLIEAYAYGRPVIAANTGGTPEMVRPGHTGYIFDPLDVDQFIAHLHLLAAMPLQQLLQLQSQVTAFLQQHIPEETQRYLQLYQSLQ